MVPTNVYITSKTGRSSHPDVAFKILWTLFGIRPIEVTKAEAALMRRYWTEVILLSTENYLTFPH